MNLGLKNKLLLVIVLIIFICGLAAVAFVYKYSEKSILENEKNHLVDMNKEVADCFSQNFDFSTSLVKTIARQSEVINILQDPLKEDLDKTVSLLRKFNLGNRYSAIYLMDLKGKTLVSTDPSFVGENYGFRRYFQGAVQGNSELSVELGVTSGEWGYYFSTPVRDIESNLIGVAVIKLRPEVIHEKIKSLTDEKRTIKLANNQALVLYSSEKGMNIESLGSLSEETAESLWKEKNIDPKEVKELHYEKVQKAIYENKQSLIYEEDDQASVGREIVSFSHIKKYPYFVVIIEGVAPFSKEAQRIAFYLSLFVAFCAVGAIVLISYFISGSLNHLEKLKKSADRIASGNYNVFVPEEGEKEVKKVAVAFNKMAKEVEKTKKNIDKKVKKRTERLKKLNRIMTGRELKMMELKEKIKDLEEELKRLKNK
ncbi:MAG TPA: cache domain-containing protein [Patescibacteria group bacterium]|nr:cache domain-containing protein [Patescibacteria group bacterium]